MTPNGAGKRGKAVLHLNAGVYSLDAVMSACYLFLDRAYFHLDGDPKKSIRVDVQIKEGGRNGSVRRLVGEFRNELLNQCLRVRIARENRKIREYIVSQALMAAAPQAPGPEPKSDEELEKILAESEPVEGKSYLDDPLGIAIPWEEKYAKPENIAQQTSNAVEAPIIEQPSTAPEASVAPEPTTPAGTQGGTEPPIATESEPPSEERAASPHDGVQPEHIPAAQPPRDDPKV